MLRTLDTHLFIEIITTEGAKPCGCIPSNELRFEYYTGPSGRKIPICMHDEDVDEVTASIWLKQLGLDELIELLFPPIKAAHTQEN